MLVLSRALDEKVIATASNGERIVFTIVRIRRDVVRIGVDAPASVSVHREEIQQQIDRGERGPR